MPAPGRRLLARHPAQLRPRARTARSLLRAAGRLRLADEVRWGTPPPRRSPQRNINKIRDVRNTNHAPATTFESITYKKYFSASARPREVAVRTDFLLWR